MPSATGVPSGHEAGELAGRHVVLGLSGGIACYKAAELVRAIVTAGGTVQVVMTEAAEHFITATTLQALSNRPVYTSQWDARQANNMAHINLTREASCVLVAPASADFVAKLLHGRADDLLSLLCLARPLATCPLLLAPAMNREMWAHPATQRNVAQLAADGATILGPGDGDQACGEVGDGRMLEPMSCSRSWSPRSSASVSPASASSSAPGRPSSRSIRCAGSPTARAARWASRSPVPPPRLAPR